MNDDLQPLKNRLRWLNRSILILGVAILLGVIVWAVRGLGGSESGTKSTVVHPASSASNVATRAASAVTAAQPKPALSTAQQERAAAAAMSALSSASAPAPAAPAQASAPVISSKASSPAAASVVASAPATQAVAPETTASAVAPPSTAKPKPKTPERKSAAPVRTAKTSTSAAKHRQAGTVGVCHAAGWYVQVGAFGKQQSIDRLARKLHGAGYTRVCVAAQDVRGLRLFYVGPYRNADAARAARDPLRKLTGTEGILRKLP